MVCFSFRVDWISLLLILAPPLVGWALLHWLLQLLLVPLGSIGSAFSPKELVKQRDRLEREREAWAPGRPGGRPRRSGWMKLMDGWIVAKWSDFRSLVTEMGRKVFWWTFLRCHLPWGTQKEHPLFDGDFGSESWAGRSDLIRFQL